MKQRQHHHFRLLMFLAVIGHASADAELAQIRGTTMATDYVVNWVDNGNAAPEQIHAEVNWLFDEINQQLSNWNPQSWISQFNRNTCLEAIAVPDHAAEVLAITIELVELSKGSLDPSISPLIELWGFGASEEWAGPPTPFEIELTLENGGIHNMSFDPKQRTLRKHLPEFQLNLSAVAKGYVVDAVAEILQIRGVDSFLINIGGEVRVGGMRPDGKVWVIRIPPPIGHDAETAYLLEIGAGALATSGVSQRFFEWQGKRYSHLIDPRSGYPISHSVLSVSVRAPTCAQADGLATAACVLGFEEGMALIESIDSAEALFHVKEESGIVVKKMSSGWE